MKEPGLVPGFCCCDGPLLGRKLTNANNDYKIYLTGRGVPEGDTHSIIVSSKLRPRRTNSSHKNPHSGGVSKLIPITVHTNSVPAVGHRPNEVNPKLLGINSGWPVILTAHRDFPGVRSVPLAASREVLFSVSYRES